MPYAKFQGARNVGRRLHGENLGAGRNWACLRRKCWRSACAMQRGPVSRRTSSCPGHAPRQLIECRELGAHVTLMNGLITDCGKRLRGRKNAEGWSICRL